MTDSPLPLSDAELDEMRARWAEKPKPICRLCDTVMEIHRMGGGQLSWYCSGTNEFGGYREGRSFADDHFGKSRVDWPSAWLGDKQGIRLLDENIRLRTDLTAAQEERDNIYRSREVALRDQSELAERLEKAEARIAELELRIERHRKAPVISRGSEGLVG